MKPTFGAGRARRSMTTTDMTSRRLYGVGLPAAATRRNRR
jgi:hypothetical protein